LRDNARTRGREKSKERDEGKERMSERESGREGGEQARTTKREGKRVREDDSSPREIHPTSLSLSLRRLSLFLSFALPLVFLEGNAIRQPIEKKTIEAMEKTAALMA